MAEFAVAVTVRVNVPGGVPLEPDDPDDPPPHESSSAIAAIAIIIFVPRSMHRLGRPAIGNTNIPIPRIADAHDQCGENVRKSALAMLGAVVLTITAKVDALVALTVTVLGTEQTAFVGAPVQTSDAVAPIPSPPTLTV